MGYSDRSKEDLIDEINHLRASLSRGSHVFPGLSVINKYEKVLSVNEEKLKSLFISASDIIMLINKNGRIMEINHPVNGLKKEDFIHKVAYDLVAPEFHYTLSKAVLDVFKNGTSVSFELKGNIDKLDSWYSARLNPVFNDGKITGITILCTDITAKKLIEDKVAESEKRYKLLFSKANDAILILEDNKFLEANEKACELFHCHPQDISSNYIQNFFPLLQPDREESKSKFEKKLLEVYKGIAKVFYWKFINAIGFNFDAEVSLNVFESNGKKFIQAIIRDITERIQIREKLKEKERVLSTLMDNLPGMAYRSRNENGWIMEFVSSGCHQLTGYSREEVLELSPSYDRIIFPEDRMLMWKTIGEALKDKQQFILNYRIKTKQGEVKFVWEQGIGVWDEKGNLQYLEGFIADVTEQKLTEQKLNLSKANFKNLLNNAPFGIIVLENLKVTFANDVAENLFSFVTQTNLTNKSIAQILNNKESSILTGNLKNLENNGTVPHFQMMLKNGRKELPFGVRLIKIIHYDKPAVLMVFHDISFENKLAREQLRADVAEETNVKLEKEITHRIEIEKRLRDTQQYTQSLISSSIDMICATDLENNIIEFNKAAEDNFGYSISEVKGKHISLLFDNIEEFNKVRRPIVENGSFSGEVIHKRKNGELFVCYKSASHITDESGKVVGFMGIFRDITNLNRAQEELKASEEKYRDLFDNATDLIQSIDPDGRFIYVNSAWKRTLGINDGDLKDLHVFDIVHPDYKEQCIEMFKKVRRGENIEKEEIILVTKKGKIILAEGNLSGRFVDGNLFSTRAIFRDITERKLTEEIIRSSEQRYRAIYNQAYIGIGRVSLSGKFLDVNEQLGMIFGYSIEEMLSKTFMDITHPESRDLSEKYRVDMILEKMDNFTFEKKYIHKSGRTLYINLTVSLVRDKKGKPDYFVSVFQDITEKHEVSEKIKVQAAKMNAIIESSSHWIWTIDRKFALTSFNSNYIKSIQNIFGFKPEIGLVVNKGKMVSSEEYNIFWNKKYEEAFKGHPQHFETNISDNLGNEEWREIYLNPIPGNENKIMEVSGIAHDITHKKIAERKIRESLSEKEVLLKEVHHRVKNNLQVISSILNLQSSYIKDKYTLNMLKESQHRIKSMAFIHESLYQTKNFANIDFASYIINLSNSLQQSYDIGSHLVDLRFDVKEVSLNLDMAIPCGLILNELITNSLKYAFQDKKKQGIISIKLARTYNKIKFEIADNGKGMSPNFNIKEVKTLGLQLVDTLVDQLKGELKITSRNGLKFSIIFESPEQLTKSFPENLIEQNLQT